MTDGEVGNDLEILAEIQRHPEARVFAFGIGSSTNRFLLDGMARHGRGEVEYVGLSSEASAAAKRFYERVRMPLLTDVSFEVSGVPVAEIYPRRLPDVFSAKPVVVVGRYNKAGRGIVRVRGMAAGKPWWREIAVDFPAQESKHDALASLWARRKIDDLMNRDLVGLQRGTLDGQTKEAITQLGLTYKLMTQYTSFIAVDEKVVYQSGQPHRIEVPVEMPAGVSYAGMQAKTSMAIAPLVSMDAATDRARVEREVDNLVRQAPRAASVALVSEPAHLNKLDPALQAIGAGRTIKVEIWLTASNPALLTKLKQLGFVLANSENGQRLIGTVPSGQLRAIAEIEEVRLIKGVR